MITGWTRVSWNANSESDLAGYVLYVGRSTGNYTVAIDVGNVTTYVYPVDQTGNWYFALTAYNTTGLASGFSNEISGFFETPGQPMVASRPIFRTNFR